MDETFKDISRRTWRPGKENETTVETIQLGALLRIADATEVMAIRYTDLIDEVARLRRYNAELDSLLRSERHRSAQRLGRIRLILKAKKGT